MAGRYVVVRLPAAGTLFAEVLDTHPGARVTCIGLGRHAHEGRSLADHLALVEGLPDSAVAGLLLAWDRCYGEPPQALGGPFALRLPMDLTMDHSAVEAACLRLGAHLPDVRHRVAGGVLELWSPHGSEAEAEAALSRLRGLLAGMPVIAVATEEPRPDDAEAWAMLREAADLVEHDRPLAEAS